MNLSTAAISASARARACRCSTFSDAQIYADTGISLLAAQIYGNDIDLIANGAREFERRGAQVVDINFGCSVPKIVAKGCGAAYLRDLDRLYQAVERTVKAVSVPVIVKTRLGWDEEDINILEVVRRCEDAGAQAVAIHARTVVQKYKGRANWHWIGRAVEAASLPIIGNGDVLTLDDARLMQRETGCAAVMVGRAALANPWLFSGRSGATLSERIDLALEQLRLMAAYKGRAHRRPRDAQAPRPLLQKPTPRLRTAPPLADNRIPRRVSRPARRMERPSRRRSRPHPVGSRSRGDGVGREWVKN